ncbi:EsaB/YukD family protein [Georgenia sp. MJ173]|uniref:EsaB/YukD family protein n=1 Tax=Georgenia sunbinii TaxID=3117728 RepID=UPI002F26968D
MSDYTRLTLVGTSTRADVVVPSTEALGAMVPDLLALLREEPHEVPQSVSLVRVTGEQVDLGTDCLTQNLPDGEVLRLVRTSDAPPPPQVADVTDSAADHLAERDDRWTLRTRQAVATMAVGIATAVASLIFVLTAAADTDGLPLLAGGVLVAAVVAAALGRAGRHYAGGVLTAVGVGLVPALVLAGLATLDGADMLRLGLVAIWAVLGAGIGIGRASRGALTGAIAGIALTLLALALGHLLPTVEADAIVAAITAIAAGLLPWYAMTSSGLTGLDDQALDGDPPATAEVRTSIDDAYRVLTWSTVAVAITAAWATAGLLTSDTGAAVVLGLLTVVVLALRTRSLPLRAQVVALWAAVLVPVTVLLLGPVAAQSPTLATAVAAGLGVVIAIAAALTPSGRQRARFRRLGDLVETIGVLGILPVLLGVLGVYGRLLETF